jgi:hypothetical protein
MSKHHTSIANGQTLTGHRPPRPRDEGGPGGQPARNDAESPLAWLRARRGKTGQALISDSQYLAGERLRSDFERAHFQGRVTTRWDLSATSGRSGGNAVAELSDGAIAARERYHRAIAAVGPELAGILVPVCCLAAGLEQAERLLNLPQRSGKAVLGLALTALVRHYGIRGGEPQRSAKARSWGLPGYRPALLTPDDA